MTARGVEVITFHEPPQRNGHGDPLPGTSPERTAQGCIIWPRTSTEDAEQGRRYVAGFMVFVPPGELVPSASATVVARGREHEVDGEPGHYISKGGEEKGTIVVLSRAGAAG